jgi:tetratricopeptide (TPR) repeat protein
MRILLNFAARRDFSGGLFCLFPFAMRNTSLHSFALFLCTCALLIACGNPAGPPDTGATETPAADSLLDAINRRIAANPEKIDGYLERAKYYGDLENFTEAFRDIDRALAIDSTQGAIYLIKGELHWIRQDVRNAYDTYKKCVSIQPNETGCLLKKAAIDITLGNFTIALDHLNTVLRQDELLPEPYYLKGRLFKEMGDTTLACSSYQTAIELDPNYYDAYIEVGLLYHEKKHDLAREYYSAATEVRPASIEAWYNKAMYLQETGFRDKSRYDEARSCYKQILEIDPAFAPAWFNQGYIDLEYLGNFERGVENFTKAIGLNPSYYQAYYNRGLCLESLNRRQEAERDYRQALTLKPDYTEAALSLNRILGVK